MATRESESVETLEADFRAKFPGKPTSGRVQSLSGRIYRSLSWFARAEASAGASQFVDLWISLNALYGVRPYGRQPDRKRSESDDFRDFLDRLDAIQKTAEYFATLVQTTRSEILGLIGSQFLWPEYWLGRRDVPQRVKDARDEAQRGLRDHRSKELLIAVFPRLLTLRNQIFHGSAAENTQINVGTLKPGSRMVRVSVMTFLRVMIDHGLSIDWPPLAYPPSNSPQHPRR